MVRFLHHSARVLSKQCSPRLLHHCARMLSKQGSPRFLYHRARVLSKQCSPRFLHHRARVLSKQCSPSENSHRSTTIPVNPHLSLTKPASPFSVSIINDIQSYAFNPNCSRDDVVTSVICDHQTG